MKYHVFETLYAKWFNSKIEPRGINLHLPMSDDMKAKIAEIVAR
jgi:hypothetical protein